MNNTTNFSPEQITTLQNEFFSINSVNPDVLPKFHALFAGCSDEALKQLARAKIKFVSQLAVNACARRNIKIS